MQFNNTGHIEFQFNKLLNNFKSQTFRNDTKIFQLIPKGNFTWKMLII